MDPLSSYSRGWEGRISLTPPNIGNNHVSKIYHYSIYIHQDSRGDSHTPEDGTPGSTEFY
jgi:hypothetical protein